MILSRCYIVLGGDRSDWLAPLGAVRLGSIGLFGSMLNLHLCLA
jgi:hypothetical protein